MSSKAELEHEELEALIDVSLTVNASLEWEKVLESIMAVTTSVMKVEASALMLVNEEETELSFQVAEGDKAKTVKEMRIKMGEGIAGWVAKERKPAIVNDVSSDSRFIGATDESTGFTTKSILCVPMQTKEKLLGVIEVINRLDGSAFTEHDQLLCSAIANQAAIALENSRLHEEKINQERLVAIGQTVAGLAHCIKNILNSIGGGSYILEAGVKRQDPDKVERGWGIVKKNNQFMEQLVLDMLSYSKERKPEYSEVDINEVCESVCQLCGEMAKTKNAELLLEGNPSIGPVQIDEKGIKRCLMNLVSNAVDASEEKEGTVRVSTGQAEEEGRFVIKVQDSGYGISEENIEKLFRVFFSTKGSKGTGLGLPVTHKIITEHGGKIDVESVIDEGTTFTITLPKKPIVQEEVQA